MFSKLETLKVCHFDLGVEDFYTSLSDMTSLTELEIAFRHTAARPLVNSVRSLTQLRSLLLEHVWGENVTSEVTEAITGMVQLTRLALRPTMIGDSLRCLTKLIDLKILGCSDLTMDLSDTVSCMRHLTSLQVHKSGANFVLEPSALQELTELRILELWETDMESHLLQVLATLPYLTELTVSSVDGCHIGDPFFAQLVPFSNLKVLGISCHMKMTKTRIASLGRCMPKIQKIQFFATEFAYEREYKKTVAFVENNSVNWSDLTDALPCLRRVRFVFADYFLRSYREYLMFSEIDLFCR